MLNMMVSFAEWIRKAAGGMPDHMVSKTAGSLADVTGPRGGVQIARMVRWVCRVFFAMMPDQYWRNILYVNRKLMAD